MAAAALVDVRDIVEWLQRTEGRIGVLYARAAEAFCEDVSFCDFLRGLAHDEESHARFMSQASDRLHDVHNRPPLDILLDGQTRGTVDDLLERFERLLAKTKVCKKDVLEYLARAEASELNPMFLYIAEEYRKTGREGEHMTGEIQKHLLRIQDFLEHLPRAMRPSVDVSTLPFVGEERFLVVEDHDPLRRLMASLLARRGAVDTAADGREGLERLREHFHDGIIANLRIPGMSGLEFYQQAIRYDARLGERFLFYSGDMTHPDQGYLQEHGLPLLRKPFGFHEFQAAIDRILAGGTKNERQS